MKFRVIFKALVFSLLPSFLIAVPGSNFDGVDLTQGDTVAIDVTGEDWSSSSFIGTTFSSVAQPAVLVSVDFSNSDFTNADLSSADMTSATLDGSDLTGAILTNADLTSASLDGITASLTQLSDVYSVRGVKFTNLDLTGGSFTSVATGSIYERDLTGASFDGSIVTNVAFTDVKLNSVNFANTTGFAISQLSDASDVRGISLSGLSFVGGDFTGVAAGSGNDKDLTGANFVNTTLTSAILTDVKLASAKFNSADLTNADLVGADLSGAQFNDVTLTGASLTNADVSNASFDNVNASITQLYDVADARGVKLTNLDLTGADFTQIATGSAYEANLSTTANVTAGLETKQTLSASFAHSILQNADFTGVDLAYVNFYQANVSGANFKDANLHYANFSEVTGFTAGQLDDAYDVRSMYLVGLNLVNADFSSVATTGTVTTYARDMSGAFFWKSDLTNVVFTDVNLNGAYFNGLDGAGGSGTGYTESNNLSVTQLYDVADARGIRFDRIDFTGADFSQVASTGSTTTNAGDLSSAWFLSGVFTGASFEDVSLNGTEFDDGEGLTVSQLYNASDVRGIQFTSTEGPLDFTGADFSQVASTGSITVNAGDLTGARFISVNLTNANLTGVDLTDAKFLWSNMTGVDLSNRTLSGVTIIDDSSAPTLSFVNLADAVLTNSSSLVARSGALSSGMELQSGSELITQGDLTIDGAGVLTVGAGGKLNVYSGSFQLSTLNLDSTATVEIGYNQATLGRARLEVLNINGDFTNSDPDGVFAPGNSPAFSTIDGNFVQGADGTIEFEIAGMTQGTEYDLLTVTGDVTIDGTIEIAILGGWTTLFGAEGTSFDFLDVQGNYSVASGFVFDFGAYGAAAGVVWDTSSFAIDGTIDLISVPEPAAYALLAGLVMFAAVVLRRRR